MEEKTIKDWRRFWFGVVYLSISLIVILCLKDIVFFMHSATNDLFSLFLRVLFVLMSGFLGISLRALKYSRNGNVSPWIPYLIKYPILILLESLFIFSILSSSETISKSYLFYTFSFPIMVYLGFGAFEAIEFIVDMLKKSLNSTIEKIQ